MMRRKSMPQNAFDSKGNWYKGNLHTHTNISDGILSPPELVRLYRDMDYDFLAITDHRVYGVHADLCSNDFLVLPGVELDVGAPRNEAFCHHIVGLGLPGKNKFVHGQNIVYPENATVKDIINILREGGNLCFYAHPAWSHARHESLDNLEGIIGLEIYNHGCDVACVCGYADSWYDRLLWQGKKFFCLATDDSHQGSLAKHSSAESPDFGGGFIMVKAPELSAEAIHTAIAIGNFYASQGPVIEDFRVKDGQIYVQSSPCRTIGIQTDSYWGIARTDVEKSELTNAIFGLEGNESYIRAVCIDASGRHAWSQPIWLQDK